MTRLILASTSRYRAELLNRLRLPFETLASPIDESSLPGEQPRALAQRLAEQKARAGARALADDNVVLLASDQTAALGGVLLRKPGNAPKALEQLIACQGESVFFYTAVTLVDCRREDFRHHLDTTEVRFANRTEAELARYVDLERPFDCAGGFKAEGLGISLFESIDSQDPTALIGLPLIWVANALRALDLNPLG